MCNRNPPPITIAFSRLSHLSKNKPFVISVPLQHFLLHKRRKSS